MAASPADMAPGPTTPSAAYKMVSITQAQAVVLEATQALPAEEVELGAALRRVLAAPVKARDPLPPFAASIMDGYALCSSDGAGVYEVAFEAHAGSKQATLEAGRVAYISTGAPVPAGASRVVPIEQSEHVAAAPGATPQVAIKQDVEAGQWIREVGSDIAAGALVLAAGERLGAAEIGILATVGAATVQVHRVPCVAVLSTGDELAPAAAAQLAVTQIRDANRPMLLAAAAEAGASTLDMGIIADAAGVQGLEQALEQAIARGADVLLTSGGVSMGNKDFVKPFLESRGTVHFGKVCMKPGKPLTFATITCGPHSSGSSGDAAAAPRQLLVFGLPGNPVSCLVTFTLVVLPCLRKLAGCQEPGLRRVQARIKRPFKLDPARPEYHRATLHWQPARSDADSSIGGEWVAESTGGQISSRLLSMRSASALLELPQASGVLAAGSVVSALLINDLANMPVPLEVPATRAPAAQESC